MVDQVYDDEDSEDEFYKEKYTVPKVGTRVRRGPHWIYENQDCESAGTIVGHEESGMLIKLLISVIVILLNDLFVNVCITVHYTDCGFSLSNEFKHLC